MSVAIFDYTDCIDYLTAVLADKKGINPNFSLRAWARQIGIANAGQLSLVLHRKRRISPTLSRRLRNSLPLDKDEVEYFDLLVLHANAATLRDQRFYQASMESFHQG